MRTTGQMLATATKIENTSGGVFRWSRILHGTLTNGYRKIRKLIHMVGLPFRFPLCFDTLANLSLGLQCNHLSLENAHLIVSLSCLKTYDESKLSRVRHFWPPACLSSHFLSVTHMTSSAPPYAT